MTMQSLLLKYHASRTARRIKEEQGIPFEESLARLTGEPDWRQIEAKRLREEAALKHDKFLEEAKLYKEKLSYLTADQAKEYGFDLDPGWAVKTAWDENDLPKYTYVSPEGWQTTDFVYGDTGDVQDYTTISPEGKRYTKAEIEALQATPFEEPQYATQEQFDLLKKYKEQGTLAEKELTTNLWLTGRQATELGYKVTPGEDFLLQTGEARARHLYGEIVPPDVPSLLQRVYPEKFKKSPETAVQDIIGLAQQDTEAFLTDLRQRGRNPDTEDLVRTLAQGSVHTDTGEPFTLQEIDELVADVFEGARQVTPIGIGAPELEMRAKLKRGGIPDAEIDKLLGKQVVKPSPEQEGFWKDVGQALYLGTQQGLFRTGQFFTTIVPELLFANSPEKRDKFRQISVNAQNQWEYWIDKHPELETPEQFRGDPFEHPELLKDPKYLVYTFAEMLPFTLALLGTTTAVTVLTGGNLPLGIAAAFALGTPMQAQDVYDDLLANGAPENKAALLALPAGMLISSLDSVGNLPLLNAIWKPSKPMVDGVKRAIVKQIATNLLKRGFKTAGQELISETLTEDMQLVIQNAVVKGYNKNRGLFDGLRETSVKVLIATAPFAIFGGAVSMRGVSPERANTVSDGEKVAKGWQQDPVTGQWFAPKPVVDSFNEDKKTFMDAGLTEEQATVKALNEAAKTPEGAKAIEDKVAEVPPIAPVAGVTPTEAAKGIPAVPEVTKPKLVRLTPEAEVQTSYQILKDKLTSEGIDPNVIDVALETYGFKIKIDRIGAVLTREGLLFKLQDAAGIEDTIRKLTREILGKKFGVPANEVDLVLEGGSRVRPDIDIAEAKALATKIADSIKRGLPTRKELLSRYLPEPAIPKDELGMPEAGYQPAMMGEEITPTYENLAEGQTLVNQAGERWSITKIEKEGVPARWAYTIKIDTEKMKLTRRVPLGEIERYYKIEQPVGKEVRPAGKGKVTQISMEDQLKLQQARQAAKEAPPETQAAYEAQAEIEGIKATHEADPIASLRFTIGQRSVGKGEARKVVSRKVSIDQLIDAKEKEFAYNDSFTPAQAKAIRPGQTFSMANRLPNGRIRADAVLDELAGEYTGGDVQAFINRVNQIRQEKARIKELEDYIKTGTKEIFPGITAVEPTPEAIVPTAAEEVAPIITEEVVTPPPTPPIQPPQTVEIPITPPAPSARNRVITQSEEVIKQSLPGAINRLFQMIPGIRQIMRWERPALRAFAEKNPHLVTAQVAEIAARSDVAAREVASRLPLFKRLHDVFGERALRGEKTDIKFVGTEEQKAHPLTGSLLDICQNPELYKLTPKQKAAIQAINTHNDASLDYVVNNYGAEIGRFAPKPDGAFLSNVDIDENIVDWLGSESRAVAQGRGKTRFWQTARDRMNADKTFKPEMDIKKLIEGMDSFKASAAGGVTFREVVGGKTRLEAMQETHPKLYDKMMALRKELQSLQGSLKRLESKLADRVTEFLESSVEDTDLATLQEELDVQLERGKRAGLNIEQAQAMVNELKEKIKELRPAWKIANLKPYVFVQEGLYRYFKPDQAKYIIQSRKTTNNPLLNFIERWRGQAFSGDFSPFAIQGTIGVLADPIGSLQATAGGVKAAFDNRDFTHSFTVDGLIDDINSDVEGWAEFASLMGRTLTGTPHEYAAGFLSSIPGFDKFTETTYITVTRGTKNLYDRTWQGLVKSGVPILEAKVAAIEIASKVYPLVNPAKLGQSQARAAVLRAIPTSYSFIRQPVTLITQASMGYAKLATFQKLTPQERIATRVTATMAASILVVSATSAAISAKARGGDDEEVLQAILDAINPDPYNGKFASIIIGDFRIPLGGHYRAIFRAIYPQEVKGIPFPVPFAGIPNFVFNRITPAVKTQLSLWQNKDYYGQQIIKGQFPENIIRASLYELEGALPLSAGELLGGVRREEFPEEIWQQVAAQFVGVNLIKLDNTYFHKLVRNLGFETQDTPSLYSLKRPIFTTNNLYGKVTSVLSDVTIDEIKKRKGYPKVIAIIIEARDLKREVDLLPNHTPVSLNADPAKDKGLTYKVLYQQWTDRQRLVSEGDDAEWVTQELVGGKYKTKVYKGDAAVKAFDKENAKAELGNMSQRQYVLLGEYWAITDKKEKAQFIKDHPEISINPRVAYLETHPKENAQLAVWGQATILTQEAFNEFKRLVKEYDIPDSALPELTLPPETSWGTHIKREELLAEGWEDSPEGELLLLKDYLTAKKAGVQSYAEWHNNLKVSDKSVEYWQMRVDNQALYDKMKTIKEDDTLDDKKKDENGLTAKDRAYAEVRATKVGDETFHDIERRVDAMNLGTREAPIPDKIVSTHVAYMRIEDIGGKGVEAKTGLFRVDDTTGYNAWRVGIPKGEELHLEPLDMTKVPIWRIDVKYEKQDTAYKVILEKYPKAPVEQAKELAAFLAKPENKEYAIARLQRDGYELGLTDVSNVGKWVEYNQLPEYGDWRNRFRVNNRNWEQAVNKALTDKKKDPWTIVTDADVRNVAYDTIYETYKPLFKTYETAGDKYSQMSVGQLNTLRPANVSLIAWGSKTPGQKRDALADADRQKLFDANRDFFVGYYRREAYDMRLTNIDDFVGYKDIIRKGKPEGQDQWFDEDWYLMEHPKFYKEMTDLYVKTDGKQGWKPKDFNKVPTRQVFALYLNYKRLPEGGVAREIYRKNHLDLDAWLVKKFGLKPITESKRRTPTVAEEIARIQAEVKGIGIKGKK